MELQNFFAQNNRGDIQPSATAYVYESGTTSLASVYNESGDAISNPFNAGQNGLIQFRVANGEYDVRVISDAGEYTLTIQANDVSDSIAAVAAEADRAEAAFDSFDDRYLGEKSAPPAADNDGDPLITGALYWDTTSPGLYVWDGSEWQANDVVALSQDASNAKVNTSTGNDQALSEALDHRVINVDTISDLKELPVSKLRDGQALRSGAGDAYRWSALDLSGRVSRDPSSVLTVAPAADETGASGAFVQVSGAIRGDGVVLTVGAGGDYDSLNACATYLTNFRLALDSADDISADYARAVEIRILSGHVVTSSMYLKAQDLGWAEITSEDATVSAVLPGSDNLFDWNNGSYGPTIATLFDMSGSGDSGTSSGILLRKGGYAIVNEGCGVINAPYRGLHLVNSMAWAVGSVWDGAGYSTTSVYPRACIRVGNGSRLMARNCSAKNCQGTDAVAMGDGGIAIVGGSDFSGSLGSGVTLTSAYIEARDCNITNSSKHAIRAGLGSVVEAVGVDCSSSGASGIASVWSISGSLIIIDDGTVNDSKASISAIIADTGGRVTANNVVMNNSTSKGIQADAEGVVVANNASINGAGSNAIEAASGKIDFTGGSAINAGNRGCFVWNGGEANIRNADLSGAVGDDIIFRTGGIIKADGATGTLNASNTENTITTNGIIFR